jgi:hypothetical protein
MAEYLSSFIYFVIYIPPDEDCGCPEGYYITFGDEDCGISVGGDEDTFAIGDDIEYEDSYGPLTLEYFGYVEDGWVGREECGCGEYDYYLITNDGTLEVGDQVDIVESAFTVCFLAGTNIACPDGHRPIEDLAIGDVVLTADGGRRPIRFIGRQTCATLFADPLRTRPIRIAAGALGDGLPVRDLCVSPDHALLIDGVLVHAGALVNGTTVTRMTDLPERFTYYHVELEDHSLILAEGVPAETFVDNVTRRRFDNYAEFEARFGEATPSIAEMALPRVKSARQLPATLRQKLNGRAALSGCRAVAA